MFVVMGIRKQVSSVRMVMIEMEMDVVIVVLLRLVMNVKMVYYLILFRLVVV